MIVFLLSLPGLRVKAQNKANRMRPIVLQTRWAKEVGPDNALKEYPRPQLVRKQWQNLNGLWQYAITKKDVPQPESYDGAILVPYPLESALSGVAKSLQPDQNLWYKRTITKPLIKSGERVLLHFGAVDWQATVYLNGKEIGQHTGGYTEFTFDITDRLITGNNQLMIKVYDPTDFGVGPHGKQVLNPGNIYYTPSSGIWQTVWMEIVPNIYLQNLTITPDFDNGAVFITPKINTNEKSYTVEVITKSKGKTVKRSTGLVNQEQSLRVANVHPWSPDDPFLYDLVVRILHNGKVVDEVKSYFGMRKIAIQKDDKGIDRIFLNNKYIYNLGTLDQGFWPDGLYTAPTDDALAFDIKAIKAMGFNTIRKHIKVEPARWYYHADKIGMLVWQDMVNPNQYLPEGSKQAFEQQCKETLEQLHNYPCITTWVLFNERWGAYDQERLTKWIKQTDPSRIVNGHSGEYLYVNDKLRDPAPNAYVGADMTDVHSYPNPRLSEKQNGKAQVCGEFGGVGVAIPYHEWNDLKGWGYIEVQPKDLTAKYAAMTKQLKQLEAEGLSGSIYTQPFDVEGEENGLLTYDREIIKMPLEKIRAINGELLPQTKLKTNEVLSIAKNADVNDTDERYPELMKAFESGKRDSIFLRRLTLMALRRKDQANATRVGNVFIESLHQKFSHSNLEFIKNVTRTYDDVGFKFFIDNASTIDETYLPGYAKNFVQIFIINREVDPNVKGIESPDWNLIKNKLNRFGRLGDEIYLQAKAYNYFNKCKDNEPCNEMLISMVEYLDKYIQNESSNHLNMFAWRVFEISSDKFYLEKALGWSKKALEFEATQPSGENTDTYANLLYKLGRIDEAIKWEQKAYQINPKPLYEETIKKMKAGQKTWPDN